MPQTATALGKLGHKDGEVCLTKAAGKHGVIQMVRHSFPAGASLIALSDPHIGQLLIRRNDRRRYSRADPVLAALR